MLILSRHRVLVATLLSQSLSQKPLFGCDMSLEKLMSQQLDDVVTSFLTTDVATALGRHDLTLRI